MQLGLDLQYPPSDPKVSTRSGRRADHPDNLPYEKVRVRLRKLAVDVVEASHVRHAESTACDPQFASRTCASVCRVATCESLIWPASPRVAESTMLSARHGALREPRCRTQLKRLRVAIAAVLVTATAGCGPMLATIDATLPAQSAPAAAPPAGDAAAALAQLPVKGRAPRTGYDRDQFGQAWKDVDRNGCDQRNDVLARDLVDETFRASTNNCIVLTGTLHDPYTSTTIAFQRGQTTSDDVQIDHVVALSNAWQTGAQQLDPVTRELFGNDPLNLLATDGPTNQAKGDGDAATWLPPNRGAWCGYVARQVAVKAKWGLWVTAAERDAINRVLGDCPGEPLPSEA